MVGKVFRRLSQPYYRLVDHHIDISSCGNPSMDSTVHDTTKNLKFVIDRFREKCTSNISVNKHAKIRFSSFFLYSATRRPKLPTTLLGSEKFHCLMVEWKFLEEREKREITGRLNEAWSFDVFSQEHECWVDIMHHSGHQIKHDAILTYISGRLDNERFRVFVDIEGHRTERSGTIPDDILVTNKRPDIVVVDDKRKVMGVYELVVPLNVQISMQKKQDKYQSLLFDNIKDYQVIYFPFAVGSVTGFLSYNDKEAIKSLHQFCKEGIRKIELERDIKAIASLEYKKLLQMLL